MLRFGAASVGCVGALGVSPEWQSCVCVPVDFDAHTGHVLYTYSRCAPVVSSARDILSLQPRTCLAPACASASTVRHSVCSCLYSSAPRELLLPPSGTRECFCSLHVWHLHVLLLPPRSVPRVLLFLPWRTSPSGPPGPALRRPLPPPRPRPPPRLSPTSPLGPPMPSVSRNTLWMQLQDIAKVFYKHYKDRGTPYLTTSKNALNGASEMLQRLKMDVYRHSLRKFVALVDKCFNAFLKFSGRLRTTGYSNRNATKIPRNFLKKLPWQLILSKRRFRRGWRILTSTFSLLLCTSAAGARSCAVSALTLLVFWCSRK